MDSLAGRLGRGLGVKRTGEKGQKDGRRKQITCTVRKEEKTCMRSFVAWKEFGDTLQLFWLILVFQKEVQLGL